MAKTVKILAAVLLGLILLLTIAIFVITRLIDPNDYKPEITAAARDNANLELSIPGKLAWTFWPSLGVQIGRTEARLPDDPELFAAVDQVDVGVAVWPLLTGKVEMDDVLVTGLRLNLVDGPGGANWERIGASNDAAAANSTTAPEEQQTSTTDIPLSIPSLRIEDAAVRYRVLADGTDIQVEHASVAAQNVSLDKPFPIQMSLRYQDQSDIRIDTSVDTMLGMNLDNNRFDLKGLKVDAEIGGITTLPLKVHGEMNLLAALDEDRISIHDLVLDAAGTHSTGGLDINQLSTKMVFAGQLHTTPFDANAALKAIGEAPIETSDATALKKISLDTTIGGPANSLMLKPLTLRVDNSTITGYAGVADLDTGKIVFDLSLDKLVADGYLPPTVADASAPAAPASNEASGILPPLSDAPLLPLDSLRSLSVDGKLHIGALSMQDIHAADLEVAVSADQGLMQLKRADGKLLDGSFTTSASLDARTDTPVMTLKNSVKGVQIQPIMIMALDDDLFTGILDMDLDFNTRGNSEKALVGNAGGKSTIHLTDGTVRGANLHNTLLGGINDLLGKYRELSAFLPGQESGKLPMELSKDTKIVDLSAAAHLEKEVAYVDSLDAQLNRGASLKGNGFLNLRSQEFDFRMGMKSPEITQSKYLKDQTWPMRCAGSLAGDAAGWCHQDTAGFKKIGKEVAAKIATDKIKDRLGIEGKGDSAEEVIKDAAKKKAQQELQKKLDDKLKGLFK